MTPRIAIVGVAGSVKGLDDDAFARQAARDFQSLLDQT
jgi:hypothetical protein